MSCNGSRIVSCVVRCFGNCIVSCFRGCRASRIAGHCRHAAAIALIALCVSTTALSAAEIEFLDGRKLEGKVLARDASVLRVELIVDGKATIQTFPLGLIHAVTINDKRHVINKKPEAASQENDASGSVERTREEVLALIEKVGREPPQWYSTTPLTYPKSLDLSWPEAPPGNWNNQKNVGQYLWDVINPNPGKWREGIRLMHHLLVLHKDDAEKRERIMITLGRMYHNLLQDYARAAYWWQKADVLENGGTTLCVHLAGCYYYLGNKPMAIEVLEDQRISVVGIKLWADMGELAKAVEMAQQYTVDADSGAIEAYLYVADGFRQAGQPASALEWYEKVLKIPAPEPANAHFTRSADRAKDAIAAVKLFDLSDPKKVRDGTYEAEAQGYEAAVRVAVTVKAGRIERVRVVQHREKQFYSALTDTPAKIIAKQGVQGVDATSNATITSNAIIDASAKALASGSTSHEKK